jgi:hypothetical protein
MPDRTDHERARTDTRRSSEQGPQGYGEQQPGPEGSDAEQLRDDADRVERHSRQAPDAAGISAPEPRRRTDGTEDGPAAETPERPG